MRTATESHLSMPITPDNVSRAGDVDRPSVTDGTAGAGSAATLRKGDGGRVLGIVPLGQPGVARGGSGWFAGAEAAEYACVLEADGPGGGLDGGAVTDQVLGSFQP